MRVLFPGLLALLLPPLWGAAQGDEAALKAAYEKMLATAKPPKFERTKWSDPAYRKAYSEAVKAFRQARTEAARKFLAAHAEALRSGVGLLYKGRALGLVGDLAGAARALLAFRREVEEHPERTNAGVEALSYLMYGGGDLGTAKRLLKELEEAELTSRQRRTLASFKQQLPSWEKREGLKGKPLPSFPILTVIGAPEDFRFEALRGKVVLLDFWATWCGPCRRLIPGLVRLQKKYGPKGLQVVGVTTFYGYGWRLTGRDGDTLQGRAVGVRGDRLSREQEIEINRVFHEGVPMNYPIVFTKRNVARETFGVRGIPTVFLVDRRGNVRYYKVGAGSEEQLEEWLTELLAEPTS